MNVFILNFEYMIDVWVFLGGGGGGYLLFIDLVLMFNIGEIILL